MGKPIHAPPEALAELAEIHVGLAPASSAAADWAEHIAHCAECGSMVTEFEEILRCLRTGDAGNAPDVWIRRAEQRAVPRSIQASLRGELRGELIYDNAFDRVAGVRADSLLGRQFVVSADPVEIEISLSPESSRERWPLTGQIFVAEGVPVSLAECRVALIENGAEIDHAMSTENGEFMLETRPRGRFELRIQGREWLIATPSLAP